MLLSVAFPAAGGAATWSMSFPSLSLFLDSAMATEVFPDGSLAAFGGDEEGRVAVVRLDPQGAILWEKRIGVDGDVGFGRIAPAADGGCLVAFCNGHQGHARHELWLMEFDGRGWLKWLRVLTTPWVGILRLQSSPTGGFFLTGYTSEDSHLVAKFGSLGKSLWMQTIVEGGNGGGGLVATPDGGCLVSGGGNYKKLYTRIVKLDARGDQEWSRRITRSRPFDLPILAPLEDGGFLAAGSVDVAGSDLRALLVAKFDRRGAVLWMRSYSTSLNAHPGAISENRDGTITVVGVTTRTRPDGYPTEPRGMIFKIDQRGEPLLGRECNTRDSRFLSGGDTPEGGFLLAGLRELREPYCEPTFLRLDAAGAIPGCDICRTISFSAQIIDAGIDATTVSLKPWKADEVVLPFGLEDAVTAPLVECRNDQVRLLSPTAGEALRSGATYPLLWERSPAVQSVDLEFSPDDGSTWEPIAAGLRGGSHPWSVPTTAPGADRALIRVTGRDAAGEILDTDAPDGSIRVEVVRVWGPDPWERIHGGRKYGVRWSVNGTDRAVVRSKVHITTNGGASWRPLGSTGQTGIAELTMPATDRKLPRCRLRVRVLDAEGRVVGQGLSEGFFTLRP